MSVGTVTNQGRFTSDGTSRSVSIRSDVDWMKVINLTNSGATGDDGCIFEWMRGMPDFGGVYQFKSGGGNTANIGALSSPNGFHLFNSSVPEVGARTALTSIATGAPPTVTVASTAGLVDGDVVRIENVTGGQQLGGIDFTITVTSGTEFDLENMPSIAVTTSGWYRKIKYPSQWYPPQRFISDISNAAQAVVTTTVDHNYKVGATVRMAVPSIFGMSEMDGRMGTVVAVTASSFTLDIDSSSFTSFVFPTSGAVATNYNYAMVFPIGVDLEESLALSSPDIDSASRNIAELGMLLPGGASAPGGSNGDEIYWLAGTSYNVDLL